MTVPAAASSTSAGDPVDNGLRALLDEVLNLGGRAAAFTADTALLGALPELDSMAVVKLITAIQERFAIEIEDDELDGSVFASLGALAAFVRGKLG